MFRFNLIFMIFASNFILYQIEMRSSQTITVMLSHNNKTASNRALYRLDVEIMKNFGKMVNLKINFTAANKELNEVFNTKDRFRKFSQSIEYM